MVLEKDVLAGGAIREVRAITRPATKMVSLPVLRVVVPHGGGVTAVRPKVPHTNGGGLLKMAEPNSLKPAVLL